MQTPQNCKSIDDVRLCIDSIDHQIIALLSKRLDYVTVAAQFKTTSLQVKAPERVKAMLETRRLWAQEFGLEPDFIEELYRNIVAFFIKGEMIHWQKIETEKDLITISEANSDDIESILALQKRAFLQEVENAGTFDIDPITQTLDSMKEEFLQHIVLKAVRDDLIVGSVRAREVDGICCIGRLIVEPIFQRKGIGSSLMKKIEEKFSYLNEYELFTGEKSVENIQFYLNRGYIVKDKFESGDGVKMVKMGKKSPTRQN